MQLDLLASHELLAAESHDAFAASSHEALASQQPAAGMLAPESSATDFFSVLQATRLTRASAAIIVFMWGFSFCRGGVDCARAPVGGRRSWPGVLEDSGRSVQHTGIGGTLGRTCVKGPSSAAPTAAEGLRATPEPGGHATAGPDGRLRHRATSAPPLRGEHAVRMVAHAMPIRSCLATLLLVLASSCAAPATSIDRLWADLEADAQRAIPLADPDAESAAAVASRAARAREIVAAGELHSARDHLRAGVVLVESNAPADWAQAAELGRRAAELGEPLGLRVAAEAIDKDLVLHRQPQRYGTQFVWDAERRSWRLHPIDPTTSDAERTAMGVPTYAELVRAEIAMNSAVSRGP